MLRPALLVMRPPSILAGSSLAAVGAALSVMLNSLPNRLPSAIAMLRSKPRRDEYAMNRRYCHHVETS
jgi:hypothetical protein